MQAAFDVVIGGGGLAGLTLSLQLSREVPNAKVLVVEPQTRPLPDACHKVGESSVELGSHYFAEVLGLRDYLAESHLFKNGLRFISGDPKGPLEARVEIGPSEPPTVPSYQMDRGKLENDLRAMVQSAPNLTLVEGARVVDVTLSEQPRDGFAPHTVQLSGDGLEAAGLPDTITARWFVDASGRRRLLQRKLGLHQDSPIKASSAWFRIGRRLKLKDLVPESQSFWHGRDIYDNRWLSTNHLCGPGYWVWLIPLSTGHTSVGIVTDETSHPFNTYNTKARAFAWLRDNEPVLAAKLDEAETLDFRVMHDYAHHSKQTFSTQRWASVGEAGIFVDPLYSPGSDLIALANSATAELIRNDFDGELCERKCTALNRMFLSWAEDTARMLMSNQDIFTQPQVFGVKLWWDFFHYWSFMCPVYFRNVHKEDGATLETFQAIGEDYFVVNDRVQLVCEAWAALARIHGGSTQVRGFVPLPMFPSTLSDQHQELMADRTVPETLERVKIDRALADEYLAEVLIRAVCDLGEVSAKALVTQLDMGDWKLCVAPERIAAEALSGAKRRRALTRVARDLERAIGPAKTPGGVPLDTYLRDLGIAVGGSASDKTVAQNDAAQPMSPVTGP